MAIRFDVTELHGWGRLAFDATLGVTAVVEGMHHNIARGPWFRDAPKAARTRGLTGLVYASIRGVTRLVGKGYDAAFAARASSAACAMPPQREAVVAALNGVLGDHLAETGNPLAISMRMRSGGQPLAMERDALAAAFPSATPRLLVLVHGLCTSDLRWLRKGHDHGAALARDLGYTPVYLHYNSGLHVSTNGRGFAAALDALVRAWPVAVDRLTIVAHSMGGLVTRSACHHAAATHRPWLRHLADIAFLGTPHHGAPLERGGNWVDVILGVSPYTAPLARVGQIRSAGITDLRHGNLVDEDWHGRDRFVRAADARKPIPLPRGVRCLAVAATTARGQGIGRRVAGDGIVPIDSALGRHRDPSRTLELPEDCRFIARGVNHLDLLSDPAVYERLRGWLAG